MPVMKSQFTESKEYISKIAEIILRDRIQSDHFLRTRTKSDNFQELVLHSRTKSEPVGLKEFTKEHIHIHSFAIEQEFWRQSVPLHFDLLNENGSIIERWIISFTLTSAESMESEFVSNDFTEWKLLVQSLYSKMRSFPLSNALMNGRVKKTQLKYRFDWLTSVSTSHGTAVDHTSNFKSFLYQKSPEFDSNASINVFKFKPSSGPFGTLHLSVVYDTNLTKFEKDFVNSFDFSKLSTVVENLKEPEQNGSVISAGTFEKEEPIPLNPSPMPSPRFQRKIVSFQEIKLEKPNSLKTKRSNLYITISRSSSNSSLESAHLEEDNILNRDGIEISTHKCLPSLQTRRGSLTPELYGTFVGSYEESILNGRMSTSPSKPIHFVADIGALAIGKCKSSLKCPAHLVVSFPAFFYQLPGEDMPTPYLGTVDFGVYTPVKKSKLLVNDGECVLENGSYRLPPKGQLQIMVKNPKCTAVKVFLIPFDFRDMPPNTKTFIRQKSYCIQKNPNVPHEDRLRFAVHLNFQMTHKKHLLLTSGIRVVFSPRPLESDETLKIVYHGPSTPKYIPLSSDKFPIDNCSCQPNVHDQAR